MIGAVLGDPGLSELGARRVVLDGGSDVWNALKMFFTGRGRIDRLTAFEFYKRLVKVLPRVLKK